MSRRVLKYWTIEADRHAGLDPRGTIALANCRVCFFTDTDHPEGTILIETPTSDKKRLAAQLGQSRIFIQCPSRDLAPDWVRKLRIASREPWCADDAAKICSQCEAAFDGAVNRRHHCRRCGEVFCAACTPQKQAMRDFCYDTPVVSLCARWQRPLSCVSLLRTAPRFAARVRDMLRDSGPATSNRGAHAAQGCRWRRRRGPAPCQQAPGGCALQEEYRY